MINIDFIFQLTYNITYDQQMSTIIQKAKSPGSESMEESKETLRVRNATEKLIKMSLKVEDDTLKVDLVKRFLEILILIDSKLGETNAGRPESS